MIHSAEMFTPALAFGILNCVGNLFSLIFIFIFFFLFLVLEPHPAVHKGYSWLCTLTSLLVGLRRPDRMLGIKSRSTVLKASASLLC